MSSKIFVVDENDEPVGEFPEQEVWEHGLPHRIVRIMLEDEKHRILLQKRSMNMKTFPGYWDHSAAGHVEIGETYAQAAQRELSEELGLTGVKLQEVARYQTNTVYMGKKLHRFNALYKEVVSSSVPLTLQQSEVDEAKWFTLAEIRELIARTPAVVTGGLSRVITEFYGR
jgi:isopentenyl-diphosphate delta-isomerase